MPATTTPDRFPRVRRAFSHSFGFRSGFFRLFFFDAFATSAITSPHHRQLLFSPVRIFGDS
jgi:hypothetical protein